jgi:hypothetical protein
MFLIHSERKTSLKTNEKTKMKNIYSGVFIYKITRLISAQFTTTIIYKNEIGYLNIIFETS